MTVEFAFAKIKKNMEAVEKAIEEAVEQNNAEVCLDSGPIFTNVMLLLGILAEKLPNKVSVVGPKILEAINSIIKVNPGFSFERIKGELEYINSCDSNRGNVSFEEFIELYAKYMVVEVYVTGAIQCR